MLGGAGGEASAAAAAVVAVAAAVVVVAVEEAACPAVWTVCEYTSPSARNQSSLTSVFT